MTDKEKESDKKHSLTKGGILDPHYNGFHQGIPDKPITKKKPNQPNGSE